MSSRRVKRSQKKIRVSRVKTTINKRRTRRTKRKQINRRRKRTMKGGGDENHPKLQNQQRHKISMFPFQERMMEQIERRLAERRLAEERLLRSEQNLALAKQFDLPPDILKKISQHNSQIPSEVLNRFMGVPR